MKLTLQDTTGQKLDIQVPTHWGEVTMRTFISLEGKSDPEIIAILCGMPLGQYLKLGLSAVEAITSVLDFVMEDPLVEEKFTMNIGAESIGQMELAKKVIMDTKGDTVAAMPYLYAIFMLKDQVNIELAFVQGFPEDVADQVRDMPVTEVYGPAGFFLNRCSQYLPIMLN